MRDFVVSYVEHDRPWADWVAWEIERTGTRVSLQPVGRRGRFDSGSEDRPNRTYVPLLSSAYRRRAHRAAVWWWLEGAVESYVAPIRVAEVDLSDLACEFLDLAAANDEMTTADQIRRYLGLAALDNGTATTSRLFGWDSPAFPPELSPVWRMGPRRPELVAGVDALTALADAFAGASTDTKEVIVSGEVGAGKTGLVVEYAHRYAKRYDGCWLIEAATPALLPVQFRRLTAVGQSSGLSGRWLLVLVNLANPNDVTPSLSVGWHVIVTSVSPVTFPTSAYVRIEGRPPVDAAEAGDQAGATVAAIAQLRSTAPLAVALLHLLSAMGPTSVPIPMLIAGADGAPSELAGPLNSRSELDDLIDMLCAAGLTRRTPDTVSVRSTVREPMTSYPGHAAFSGRARNVVMLATLAYRTRDVGPAGWLPLLPHVISCLDVQGTPNSYHSLLDYIHGWDAGDLQPVTLLEALEAASKTLCEFGESDLALELADRGDRLATSQVDPSETVRIQFLHHRATLLRLAGRAEEALNAIERAERAATAPICPGSDRRLPFEPLEVVLEKAQILADLNNTDAGLQAMERVWQLLAAGVQRFDTRFCQYVHAKLLTSAGHIPEAIDRLTDALAAPEPDNDMVAALCHRLLADLYLMLNRSAEAHHYAQTAADIIAAIRDTDDLTY